MTRGYVHQPSGAFLERLRHERAGRINGSAQDFDRFLGNVQDGKAFQATARLAMSPEYFTSEPFLASQDWADWQHTPAELRMFAAAFAAQLRRRSVPIVCSSTSSHHVCLRHTRYKQLTRQEWQSFGFTGMAVAERLGLPVEWAGFDVWQLPHAGPEPYHYPHLVQRYTLAGLRRMYPAKMAKQIA